MFLYFMAKASNSMCTKWSIGPEHISPYRYLDLGHTHNTAVLKQIEFWIDMYVCEKSQVKVWKNHKKHCEYEKSSSFQKKYFKKWKEIK